METGWLKDKQVAVTGKLASMTRREVAALIASQGGRLVPSVNGDTTYLVVGQESLPIQKDGELPPQLQRAKRLPGLTILTEEELFARLGCPTDGVKHYTVAELARILDIPGQRIRAWMHAGLIQPAQEVGGVPYFAFPQVVGAKTLCDLAEAGVNSEKIRRSLDQLRAWFPVSEPLAQLALVENNGNLMVRLDEGLADSTGQLHFDFHEEPNVVPVTRPASTEDWFAIGCDHEDAGRMPEAVAAYRRALIERGPDALVSFNLANVLNVLGKKDEASEHYRQVLEHDPSFAEAWNNLANILVECEQYDDAIDAYRRAIGCQYLDAHYNLADLLEDLGRRKEAREHWRAYVRYDPQSAWGNYARSKLA